MIHHLTVAEDAVELQDEVEATLTPHLPIEVEADEVELLAEDATGRWHRAERFPLGG